MQMIHVLYSQPSFVIGRERWTSLPNQNRFFEYCAFTLAAKICSVKSSTVLFHWDHSKHWRPGDGQLDLGLPRAHIRLLGKKWLELNHFSFCFPSILAFWSSPNGQRPELFYKNVIYELRLVQDRVAMSGFFWDALALLTFIFALLERYCVCELLLPPPTPIFFSASQTLGPHTSPSPDILYRT